MAVTNSHPTSRLARCFRKLFDLNIVVEQSFVYYVCQTGDTEQSFVYYVHQTGDTEPFTPRVPLVIPSIQKQNPFLPPTEVHFYTLFILVL